MSNKLNHSSWTKEHHLVVSIKLVIKDKVFFIRACQRERFSDTFPAVGAEMASVRDVFLYSAIWLSALASNCDYGYGNCNHGHGRGRKRVVSRVLVREPQERRVHVTHEVHHVVHNKRRRAI